jgi:hypothetical protein
MPIPIYITNFNNLDRGFRQLVSWLQASNCDITVIDNASTWPPLMDWYNDHLEVRFRDAHENLGPYAFWELGLHKQQRERFIVTDPDLRPTELCPSALLTIDRMEKVMDTFQVGKVGVSLSLDNIPEYYKFGQQVRDWESQFWTRPTEDGLAYHADIDTTFCLYEPGSECHPQNPHRLRLAPPYTFEHVPWYEDSSKPHPERDYYLAHIDRKWTDWSRR